MTAILITGMSGTGKSTAIEQLAARGYDAVDLDASAWSEYVPDATTPGRQDWIWREDRVTELLSQERCGVLFVSGCASNQVKFYGRFDHIVLLTAPPAVLVERLTTRTNNPYGKTPEQLAEVLHYQRTVEPLLRNRATLEITTDIPIDQVVAAITPLAAR